MFYCPLCKVIPSHFNFSTLGVLAANGSSATGHCSDITLHLNTLSTCSSPASSVLFDGVIPTLTALDGNTWATQLMILRQPLFGNSQYYVTSSFASIHHIRRVEVVLFNCPQRARYINIDFLRTDIPYYRSAHYDVLPTLISCDSLVKVCIPVDFNSTEI